MKGRETYRQLTSIRDTEKAKNLDGNISNYLRKNYLEIGVSEGSVKYLGRSIASLLLITHGKDICEDYVVDFQFTTKGTPIPKELIELLEANEFIKVLNKN